MASVAKRKAPASNGHAVLKGKAPARQDTHWTDTLVRLQLEIASSIVICILALNALFPHFRDSFHLSTYQTRLPAQQFTSPLPKFIYLSYKDPSTGNFFKGNDDIYFVAFWALVWISARVIAMRFVFEPLARKIGVKGAGKVERFAEQGYTISYYVVFWSMGLVILSQFPGPWLDVRQYWRGYPHDCIPAMTKFYYLSQTAFWFQQMIGLQIEKHRKDHVQMYTHHVVTILLVTTSYCTNFTGIGTAIHTTMDLSDIFLSGAKMQKYAGLRWQADFTFVLFLVSWVVTRHYVYLRLVWGIYRWLPVDVPFAWRPDPDHGQFLTRGTWIMFLSLLMALQALLVMWFALIVRVTVRVLKGGGADDARSDSEDGDEEDDVTAEAEDAVDGQGLRSAAAIKPNGEYYRHRKPANGRDGSDSPLLDSRYSSLTSSPSSTTTSSPIADEDESASESASSSETRKDR